MGMGSGLGVVALAVVVFRNPTVRRERCEDKGLQQCDTLKQGQVMQKAS